jgi:hypothetical protein
MQPPVSKINVSLHPDGYLDISIMGDQTGESFRAAYRDIKPLIAQLGAAGKPLLGLIDMTHQTGYSLASDKAALEVLESIKYEKLAMCNPPHPGVAQGIILAMGRSDNTRVFDMRERALTWLLAA